MPFDERIPTVIMQMTVKSYEIECRGSYCTAVVYGRTAEDVLQMLILQGWGRIEEGVVTGGWYCRACYHTLAQRKEQELSARRTVFDQYLQKGMYVNSCTMCGEVQYHLNSDVLFHTLIGGGWVFKEEGIYCPPCAEASGVEW